RDHAVPFLVEAGHHLKASINDSPGQIAAEGAEQHLADSEAACPGDAERAGESEDHDQSRTEPPRFSPSDRAVAWTIWSSRLGRREASLMLFIQDGSSLP